MTSPSSLRAIDPVTGEPMPPEFYTAPYIMVEMAARQSEAAAEIYGRTSGRERGAFLRRIADRLEALKEKLVARAHRETALPEARLQSEVGRTCGQLRMFAELIEEGSWVDARIDRPDPGRQPVPKPDVRSLLRPLGPVAVFSAANFPLAFSVAGGDTASALAAGCPVIAVAHPSHPGTAELAGLAIKQALLDSGLPTETFILLFSADHEVGKELVRQSPVRAVGFTGSRQGGLALSRIAAERKVPIPVFAEMSSVNPVFVLPGALRERGEAIAAGLQASVTLGVGQFCTKPGLVFLEAGEAAEAWIARLAELLAAAPAGTMLNPGIHAAYQEQLAARTARRKAERLVQRESTGFQGAPALFRTDAPGFLGDGKLRTEIFGPATVVVTHEQRLELELLARRLEGQLTATLHGTPEDLVEYRDLVEILEQKAGRLVLNAFPTGVEVGPAMVHGGPFPATSDGRSTSVGTRAILRFVRPVCYQSFPDAALPEELRDGNPLGLWRQVDGRPTRDAL